MMTHLQALHFPRKVMAAILSALLIVSTFLFAQPAHAASSQIINNVEKTATDGLPVWAQGGWMVKEGNTFYLYGLDASQPSKLPDGSDNPNWKKKISVYTSTDLVTWTPYREIVDFESIDTYRAANPGTTIPAFSKNQWFGRPVVQYNSVIDKYVMYMEWGYGGGNRNTISIWYSDTPTGTFTYQKNIIKPNGYAMGDMGSVFTDTDGSTYLSYTIDYKVRADGTPDYNSGIQISKLETSLNASNNYEINIASSIILSSVAPYKEATTLFKVGSKYYMMASQTNGYESSQTYYYTADSMNGPWSSAAYAGATIWNGASYAGTSPTGSNSFDTQIDQILPIQGTGNNIVYLFIGDRWNNMKNKAGTGPASTGPGRNAFYPLTFNADGKPVINGFEKWNIDLTAGTWSQSPPDLQFNYSIVNSNSGKALGIVSNQTTDNAALEQRPYTGAASQSWQLVNAGSGYYKIKNSNSGKFMAIKDASTADGGQVIQWSESGSNNQQWQLVDAGGGFFNIKNRNSGKLLGMNAGSTADGASVIQWADSGSANQKWQFEAIPAIDLTQTYSITNQNSSKALGTVGHAAADGTNIEQRTFSSAASQSWQFEFVNGYYKIKNVNSGKYMDIASSSTADGAKNVINPASSANSQLWKLVYAGNGYYKLKNVNSGKMLGLSGGSTADGALNTQWPESGSANQNWSFTVLNP
ncbi:RICIN domain-containing protein [Paenibacillus pasadenensis]|uniref:RICIN domain-containing protein n=1 Tax=Paenibacillus pasadenensis TaxID=217090 RepID=UPI002041D889|nr:RICIN domain-containing protein [Paenibacillus pasadenensis]MCM3747819.1 RICIN domain-containing protein [Paenibacillus pasadenensis]